MGRHAEANWFDSLDGVNSRDFETCVHAHADAVHAFARGITSDPWLAEEAVHLTFVRAWQYQDSFRGDGSYQGWLLRICRNVVIDLAAKRHDDQSIDDMVEPATHYDDASSSAELNEAMASLPRSQREALTLCGVLGYDYESAAEILDVPVGTIRSRIHRGRACLGALLDDSTDDAAA